MENLRETLARAIQVIKIDLPAHEQEVIYDQFFRYINWLEPLLKVHCSTGEPVLTGHHMLNAMREDRAEKKDLTEVQQAAENFEDGYYIVPTIID
jgi:aspartyl/glutamyl-tRNA(Asn/Gln) amidotransferase C subunit